MKFKINFLTLILLLPFSLQTMAMQHTPEEREQDKKPWDSGSYSSSSSSSSFSLSKKSIPPSEWLTLSRLCITKASSNIETNINGENFSQTLKDFHTYPMQVVQQIKEYMRQTYGLVHSYLQKARFISLSRKMLCLLALSPDQKKVLICYKRFNDRSIYINVRELRTAKMVFKEKGNFDHINFSDCSSKIYVLKKGQSENPIYVGGWNIATSKGGNNNTPLQKPESHEMDNCKLLKLSFVMPNTLDTSNN